MAPSTVFDGERMHLGTTSSSSSLTNDYSTSLATGSSWLFTGSAQMSVYATESGTMQFSWNITDLRADYDGDRPTLTLTPWLLFVEESASFPDGSNGVGDYLHVLHHAVELDDSSGDMSVQVPQVWDGDDMYAVLIVDWEYTDEIKPCCGPFPVPGPGFAAALVCFMLALLPSHRKRLST